MRAVEYVGRVRQACTPIFWGSKNEYVFCGFSDHCPARWTTKELKPSGPRNCLKVSKRMGQGRRVRTAHRTLCENII